MQCPFCHKEKDEQAPVCASCGRDTSVPETLLAERADLLKSAEAVRATQAVVDAA